MVSIHLYSGSLNIYVQFPTEWNELTAAELLSFCRHQLSGVANTHITKAAVFFDWLKGRSKEVPPNICNTLHKEDAAVFALPFINAFYEENTLTEQLIPTLTIAGITYYGPDAAFNNLTCAEYEDAEYFWHLFNQSPDQEPLVKLAAILYRPALNGSRCPYSTIDATTRQLVPYNIEPELPLFRTLPPEQLLAIFHWFTGCRAFLPKIFPEAFDNDGQDSGEPDPALFTKIIHASAGPKNGTRADIRLMLLKELFFEVNLETIKANELKQQYA